MAVLFLLLAILCLVVLGAAGLENNDPSTATLVDAVDAISRSRSVVAASTSF